MSAGPATVVEPVLQTTESWVESTSRRRSSVTTLDPVQEEEQPVENADLTRLESPLMMFTLDTDVSASDSTTPSSPEPITPVRSPTYPTPEVIPVSRSLPGSASPSSPSWLRRISHSPLPFSRKPTPTRKPTPPTVHLQTRSPSGEPLRLRPTEPRVVPVPIIIPGSERLVIGTTADPARPAGVAASEPGFRTFAPITLMPVVGYNFTEKNSAWMECIQRSAPSAGRRRVLVMKGYGQQQVRRFEDEDYAGLL